LITLTHTHTPQSVGLLWTRDRPVTEIPTWQHTTLTRDKHPCPRWDSNHDPSKRSAAVLRIRPRCRWDRRNHYVLFQSCVPTTGIFNKCTKNCALYKVPSEGLSRCSHDSFIWQTFVLEYTYQIFRWSL
jgi:hypothetical protein